MTTPKRTKTRTPGIFKTEQGRYEVFYRVTDPATGKARQRTKTFGSEKEAKTFKIEMDARKTAGTNVDPGRQTLGDYLRAWLESRYEHKATTRDNYRWEMEKHVLPRIGGVRLSELTHSHIEHLAAELLASGRSDGKGGLSPTTVRLDLRIVSSALEDAVRKGLLPRNPVRVADKPKARKQEMKVWTPEQARSFLASLDGDRLQPLYLLAFTSGMRRSELLALRWQDIDLDRRRLSVRRALVTIGYQLHFQEPKTAKSIRSIAIDPATAAALRSHHATQAAERLAWGPGYEDNGLVFCRENGTPLHPQAISRAFDRAARQTGLPAIRFHDIRHSWATAALKAGEHPKVVSERLGHSDIRITLDTYTHVIEGMDEGAAERVAAVILGL